MVPDCWLRSGQAGSNQSTRPAKPPSSQKSLPNLARKFPGMGIHLDHCGRSWDFAKWAADLAEEFPSIWAQLNFTAVTNGTVEYLVSRLGAERVLFGTDAPFDSEQGDRATKETIVAVEGMGVPECEKSMIFEDNARKLLRL